MAPRPTGEAWAQIRYDYEHTERLIEDICAEHRISSGTLRDRMRRWGWTRRRPPIPPDGPPPAPTPQLSPPPRPAARAFDTVAPSFKAAPPTETPCPADVPQIDTAPRLAPAPPGATSQDAGGDGSLAPRLQSALARVLPAIEATVATLAAGSTQPHELERAARALAALTRTLRELNRLLAQHPAPVDDDELDDIEAFRHELVRRMNAIVAARSGESDGGADPQGA